MKRLFVFFVLAATTIPWPGLATFAPLEPNVALESSDGGLGVYISEIMANPLDEDTGEFVELWNSSDLPVDIASWKLSDAGDTEDVIQDYIGTSDIGTAGTTIPPRAYALIVDSEYAGEYNATILEGAHPESFIIVTLNDSTLGNGLGNTTDSFAIVPSQAGATPLTASWATDAGNGVSWAGFSLLTTPQFVKSRQDSGSSPAQNNNMAPQAALTLSADHGFAPLTISVDASDSTDPEGLPLSFEIDFGDGVIESYTSPTFVHTYGAGAYTIKLSATDSEGIKSAIEKSVTAHQRAACTLFLTEVLPNPEGNDTEKEFIEIFNAGSAACNLNGYTLDDAEGGSSPYALDGTELAPGEHKAFFSKETKITLNNENESARLRNSDGTTVSEVSFVQSFEGKSYAKKGSAFEWTSKITPSAANAFDEPQSPENPGTDPEEDSPEHESEEPKPISIAQAKKLERNDSVVVEGLVVIKPGVASKNWFYVQDVTGGMQIYSSRKEFPKLRIGQRVRVTGKISETKRGKRILVDSKDNVEIMKGEGLIRTISKKTGKVQAADEGLVVRVTGVIEKKQGSVVFVNDGSGTVRVSIPAEILPEAKTLKKGAAASLQGVVVQNSSGPTVVPRSKEDLSPGSASLPKAGASYEGLFLVIVALVFSVLALTYLAMCSWQSTQAPVVPHL